MNITELLNPEIQKYIFENTDGDLKKLVLQKNPFTTLDYKEIINQIEARSKAQFKLSTWFNSKNCIYPNKISIEQASSEVTAQYKSNLISGQSLIDLTGGFGVDDYYFAKKIKSVIHCEINKNLSEIVSHNFKLLKALNITCISGDSYTVLNQLNQNFSWIYIDPSRRNDAKGKVFMLKDCLPNVIDLQEFYFKFTNNILIKTAPILDLSAGLQELKNVKQIHIIAINNEVKELLWVIEKNYNQSVTIKTIHFNKEKREVFDFIFTDQSTPNYELPKKYLYEPNSAIMKSGGFNAVAQHYKLNKLQTNSHLYTSDSLIDFPGRIFIIDQVLLYTKKIMMDNFYKTKMNVTVRNFPDSVASIRKKWKISDGGNLYSFFTINKNDDKIVLLCNKLK